MEQDINQPTFQATQTQCLIAAAALNSLHGGEEIRGQINDPMIEDFARMLVIIQKGGMLGYFANGTDWSFRSRAVNAPEQVEAEIESLHATVDRFHEGINSAKGKAACRIRENRARRLRENVQENVRMLEDQIELEMARLQPQNRVEPVMLHRVRDHRELWGEFPHAA